MWSTQIYPGFPGSFVLGVACVPIRAVAPESADPTDDVLESCRSCPGLDPKPNTSLSSFGTSCMGAGRAAPEISSKEDEEVNDMRA